MLKPWETKFWLEDSPDNTLHSKLLNKLTLDIKDGRLPPGSMLPGSRSLANQLGINRKTVQQVFEELEVQGWLVTRPRVGTFVSEILPEKKLRKIEEDLVNSSHNAKTSPELVEMLYQNAIYPLNFSIVTNDGTPDSRLIPYSLLARTYRRACVNLSRKSKLGYGDPRGTMELRKSVRKMLSADRYMNCSSDQICIVRGSQMAIYLTSRILDSNKGAIIMENLCYRPAQAAFESNGFKVLKCEIDNNGLNIEHLQKLLTQHNVVAVYVTPHHQYPTTVSLSMDRRLTLLKLSKRFKFAVIEDDYDHEFHYDSRPIPPLASLPNSENVIHIGSMSKVFAPGLRLGYMAANSMLIERAAQEVVLIDRQGNTLTEIVLSELMEAGEVKRHIRKIRKEYKSRRDFAAKEFNRLFGNKVTFKVPTGGMAIWVNISKYMNGKKLENLQSKDSILSTFYANDQEQPTHIRFGFGALNESEITNSIEHLYEMISQ